MPTGYARPVGDPVLLVMGVSASGKTTVGRTLAERTGWPFLDADDLHSPEAVARMAAGKPLTDAERWPWLDRIAAWIAARRAAGEPGVVACSALKRSYRDRLRVADPDLRLVYLRASREQIADRLNHRTGHFFPPVLAWAQFDDLEDPDPDERAITVPMGRSTDDEVDEVLAALGVEA
jgi:carbohydrate kinase (thermoresistant glucokinase family)